MTRATATSVETLAFSDETVEARLVTGASHFPVNGRAVVVNISAIPAVIAGSPPQTLAPFDSTLVRDALIGRASALIVLRVLDDAAVADLPSRPGWRALADLLDDPSDAVRRTALWRSPKADAGALDPAPAGTPPPGFPRAGSAGFDITANLWFAPPLTDCLIHDRHGFVEFHAQIHGTGSMQKFREADADTLYEERILAPGAAHPVFDCEVLGDGTYRYPWHQYRAETACVWLAVEYHPRNARPPAAGRE